ncbi:MAG: non-heme iron oxygenase ferredoxin subunit [Fimbriimonadaceae bacterium]|nr:non-heme iron oxygenase ferredoxin subunit [Fimbriimonadaceae bacterium]
MAELVRVAAWGDIPEGGTLRVHADQRWICLYKVAGEVYATADECSHAVASLADGKVTGHTVECPRHGAKFDIRTGKQLCFPAVTPVRRYAVVVTGDEVSLQV